MTTIATLITVHNRKQKTLQCLRCLYKQVPIEGYELDVFLTDDGCTDGTPESIREEFPQVTIIKGDGSLFWNRGMYAAWSKAVEIADYDYYLWLNDDTALFDDSLTKLLCVSNENNDKCIVVGATCDSNKNHITYGGRDIKGKLLSISDTTQKCEAFNGNIVLIPRYVYQLLGKNKYTYRHALGDFDYGLRAYKKGVTSIVAPGFLGVCNNNVSTPTWCNPQIRFRERWKAFRTPLGNNPEELFIFSYQNYGILIAIMHYITNHIRVCFPSLWIK